MSETATEVRVCYWCGKPAPEGVALMSIWWADYECCSMECVMLAETEDYPAPAPLRAEGTTEPRGEG